MWREDLGFFVFTGEIILFLELLLMFPHMESIGSAWTVGKQ